MEKMPKYMNPELIRVVDVKDDVIHAKVDGFNVAYRPFTKNVFNVIVRVEVEGVLMDELNPKDDPEVINFYFAMKEGFRDVEFDARERKRKRIMNAMFA